MEHINGIKGTIAAVLGCLTALWGWFGWLVVAWVACMLLDYATGTAAALKAGKWSCKAAREGLWHKVGAMAAVLVAAILDGVLGLILDHIPALTLPFDYTVFLTVLVLVWYILTELGSIVENAGRLGAPLPAWLSKAIAALESGVKVMTRSRSISIGLSPVIILMIRSTRTAVLPLPAAAETSRFRFLLSITAFCSFVQFTVIFRLPPFSASAISVCPAVFWCVFVNLLPDIFRVQLIKPPVSVPICF